MRRIQSEAFGLSARGGLHVPAAQLWLDGLPRDGIAFRSDLNRLPRRLHRVLCSPTLAALMRGHSIRPLVLPWGQPLTLGVLTIELHPAGSGPGASLLRMHVAGKTVLYAAAARPQPLPTSEALQLPPADVLVLDAELADDQLLSPSELALEVDAWLRAPPARGGVWLFDRRTSALDLARMVGARMPLLAHAGVLQLAAHARSAGVALPAMARARRLPRGPALVLWPLRHLDTLEAGPLAGLPRILVAETRDPTLAARVGAERHLRLARRASGVELDAVARQAGVQDVIAFGRGAQALCERLQAQGLRTIELIGDPQLPLV